jgi:ribonuclease III
VAAGNGAPIGGGEGDRSKLLAALDVPITHDLLERALTHRSYAYENGGLPTNERLEFLGDAVLGLIVTDTLYCKHPDLPEGQLAKLRAAVVQMRSLARVARDLRLGDYVRLGRGEEGTGGRDKPSILADTLEAVIGAVYLDRGLEAACRLVHQLFDTVIASSAQLGAGLDWKTSLQELTASEFLGVPEYRVEESGPDHQKQFRATVRVAGRTYGSGHGKSKKEAEQEAAEAAYRAITKSLESEAGRARNSKNQAAVGGELSPDAAGLAQDDAQPSPDDAGLAQDDAQQSPDAAASSTDAAGSSPDAAASSPDAAGSSQDAAAPPPDAAGPSSSDAAGPSSPNGAGPSSLHAVMPSPDGAEPSPNGAAPSQDSSVPSSGGAVSSQDGAASSQDGPDSPQD